MMNTPQDTLRDALYGPIAAYCMATGVRYGYDRIVEAAVRAIEDEGKDVVSVRDERQEELELS